VVKGALSDNEVCQRQRLACATNSTTGKLTSASDVSPYLCPSVYPPVCLSVAVRANSYLFHCAQRVLMRAKQTMTTGVRAADVSIVDADPQTCNSLLGAEDLSTNRMTQC